jgi:hypothetical protein
MKKSVHDCKVSSKRKHFTEQEDHIIKFAFAEKGKECWKELGSILKRDPKQVRDRYNHSLKEPLSNDAWSREESQKLRCLMSGEYQGKWAQMEKFFPGRNQIQIKNHWRKLNSHGSIPKQPTLKPFQFNQQLQIETREPSTFSSQQLQRKSIQPLPLPNQQIQTVNRPQNLFSESPDFNPSDETVLQNVKSLGNEKYDKFVQDDGRNLDEMSSWSEFEDILKWEEV